MTDAAAPAGLLERVVSWLRAGYPEGIPRSDYPAVLSVLRRTLTSAEVERVVERAAASPAPLTADELRSLLDDVLAGPPLEEDVVRVSSRLATVGWPLAAPAETTQTAARAGLIRRVVDWLREGYPAGLPENDYVPLVALLRRRLTDDEVRIVARGLVESGGSLGRVDLGDAVARVTSELPADEDVARVRAYLNSHGWPTDFAV